MVAYVVEVGDQLAQLGGGGAVAVLCGECGGVGTHHVARVNHRGAAARDLKIQLVGGHRWATAHAGHAGFGMAHKQHIGIGLGPHDLVGANTQGGAGNRRRNFVALHRHAHQQRLLRVGPGRGVGQAGVGQRGGYVVGYAGKSQVVKTRHITAPVAGVGNVLAQHLQRITAVFHHAARFAQLAVVPVHVDQQNQQRQNNGQPDGHGDHQFHQRKTGLACALRKLFHSRLATRTRVVTARRQRSLTQAEPAAPSKLPAPQATEAGGALVGVSPCQTTVTM